MKLKDLGSDFKRPNGYGCLLYGFIGLLAISVVFYIAEMVFTWIMEVPALAVLIFLSCGFILLCVKTDLPKAIDEGFASVRDHVREKGGMTGILKDWGYALLCVVNAPAVWLSRRRGFMTLDDYYNRYYVTARDGTPPAPSDKPDSPPAPVVSLPLKKPEPPDEPEKTVKPPERPVKKLPESPPKESRVPLSPLASYAARLGVPSADLLSDEDLRLLIAARLNKDETEKALFFCYAVYCRVKKIPPADPYDSPVFSSCVTFSESCSDRARKYIKTCTGGDRLFRPYPSSSAYNESLSCLGLAKEGDEDEV